MYDKRSEYRVIVSPLDRLMEQTFAAWFIKLDANRQSRLVNCTSFPSFGGKNRINIYIIILYYLFILWISCVKYHHATFSVRNWNNKKNLYKVTPVMSVYMSIGQFVFGKFIVIDRGFLFSRIHSYWRTKVNYLTKSQILLWNVILWHLL